MCEVIPNQFDLRFYRTVLLLLALHSNKLWVKCEAFDDTELGLPRLTRLALFAGPHMDTS